MLTTAERSEILAAEIRRHVKAGYVVQTRTATTAQLFRAKQMSAAVMFASFLLVGIGVFIFLAYYIYFLRQKDSVVTLSVDESGRVSARTLAGTAPTSDSHDGLVVREYALPRRARAAVGASPVLYDAVLQPYSVHRHAG